MFAVMVMKNVFCSVPLADNPTVGRIAVVVIILLAVLVFVLGSLILLVVTRTLYGGLKSDIISRDPSYRLT